MVNLDHLSFGVEENACMYQNGGQYFRWMHVCMDLAECHAANQKPSSKISPPRYTYHAGIVIGGHGSLLSVQLKKV